MNMKQILPAAALLVLLMPSCAWSRDHYNYNDAALGAAAQPGSLTPFSNVSRGNYLTGNVNQFSNGIDSDIDNFGPNQNGAYGNLGATPYSSGAYANNYNLSSGIGMHHLLGGCNSDRSNFENALRAKGINPNSMMGQNAINNAINNPAINPYANANPYSGGMAYGNPYAAANNYGAMPYGAATPYGTPFTNGNPYMSGNLNTPYNQNPYSYNSQAFNSATSASNLTRLGSILSGSGLGNLGTYAQNGNLNGGSLSGLRGMLGI